MKRVSTRIALASVALLFSATLCLSEGTEKEGEAETRAQAVAAKAFTEAGALAKQGKLEAASDVLMAAVGTLGDAPEATALRYQAVQLLVSQFLEEGTGRQKAEEVLAHFIEGAPERYADQVYTMTADMYSLLGNYEEAAGTLESYLEKFPPPTEGELSAGQRMALAGIEKFALIGKPTPHFELTTLDGGTVSPGAFKGKVLLIDFWATWCRPCVVELPNVKEAYEEHHAKGFEIVGLSLDRDEDKLAAFLQQHKVPWKQVFLGDKAGEMIELYRFGGAIPSMFLVDRDGILRAVDLRGKALQRQVAKLVAEKAGEPDPGEGAGAESPKL